MAATDMSKAGLEVGCEVEYAHDQDLTGTVTEICNDYIRVRRKNVPYGVHSFLESDWTRSYDDAQAARHRRYEVLAVTFPDAYDHSSDDTLERFCVPCGTEHQECVYTWGDTFEEAVEQAAGHIFSGLLPAGCYDLDTGQKIDLHVANPVITPSEDQGGTVNEMDAEEMARHQKSVARHYDHIADTITATYTVDPRSSAVVQAMLHALFQQPGVEDLRVTAQPIHQVKPREPAA